MLSRIGLWIRAALPLVALGVFAATLWKCLAIIRVNGHLEKWQLGKELPMISMLGIEEPEHSVFARGFSVLAAVIVVVLLIRNHQLAREPALRHHALARRVALVIGFGGLVALLVMAWIPGDQPIHFFGALATFMLLSIYAALHTGLCVALRRAPSARPWPSVPLLAWMVVCPAASIVFVVRWLTEQSATPQYAAVALQFAYFLALVPAFAKRAPVSAEVDAVDTSSKYGLSVVAVLSALIFAVLVVPQKAIEMDDVYVPCTGIEWCVVNSPDVAACNHRWLAKDYVVGQKNVVATAYCPKIVTVESLPGAPHTLASFATPFLWVLGTLGFAVVFFERPRRAQDPKRRWLARAGLLIVALAVPRLSLMLVEHAGTRISWNTFLWRATPVFMLAATCLVVTYVRGDQLLRGKPIRGIAGPLVLAYAAIAAGIALGFGTVFRINDIPVVNLEYMRESSRQFLANQSSDVFEPVRLALLLTALPLFLMGALSAAVEPRSVLEPRRQWVALGVLSVAMLGHVIGSALGIVPIAILAIALSRHRRIGRATKVALTSGLFVADLAGLALQWTVVDAIAIAIAFVMLREKPQQGSDDTRAFVAGLAAAAAIVVYAGCLWHAQDAQATALLHALSPR